MVNVVSPDNDCGMDLPPFSLVCLEVQTVTILSHYDFKSRLEASAPALCKILNACKYDLNMSKVHLPKNERVAFLCNSTPTVGSRHNKSLFLFWQIILFVISTFVPILRPFSSNIVNKTHTNISKVKKIFQNYRNLIEMW